MKLLTRSKQIKPVNSDNRKLISGLIDLKDSAGNDIWNISIHLGLADRISVQDADGVTRSFVLSDLTDTDGGPPPLLEILEDSVGTLVQVLIIIQMLDNRPAEEQVALFDKLSKGLQDLIRGIKPSGYRA